MEPVQDSTKSIQLLSELVCNSGARSTGSSVKIMPPATPSGRLADLTSVLKLQDLDELKSLAMSNHVIVRAFERLAPILDVEGNRTAAEWVQSALEEEKARIQHALMYLSQICGAMEKSGCRVTVIKSLDHWPDLGSDLDLYTDAPASEVVHVMTTKFKAKVDNRSWGDRLANKWNFVVPDLPELVEVHVGRLGQTGEQIAVTRSLVAHTQRKAVGSFVFTVPAPEERIVISTLQRMYRHFYIRLCDVVDNASLLDQHLVNFEHLHGLGSIAGLWEGIATYMRIISEYVEAYRGYGVPLPSLVSGSAKFGAAKVRYRKQFLRVPILPQSINLYAGELKTLLLNGDLRNSFRLSLLPGLATAAALEQKLTGSDKGIW
ncbi:MAG TPA: hypothetical protein VJQ54_19350 [Candidatus Sulfotelmatobacter sp.]|nr:hypothetical protein [Candidatus Sulfotelmatobacter sp.]